MVTAKITIGHLVKETGCKAPTIRYYEEVGLLPKPRRSPGNQRLYGPEHVARLIFIRHSRELGFSQPVIRDMLKLTDHPDQSCDAVTEIARAQLREVNRRLSRLSALKAELERMIEACRGRRMGDCRIIDALAERSLCEETAAEH